MVDTIHSFESIGNQPNKSLNYAKPCKYAPAACPATIVPPDDDDDDDDDVSIMVHTIPTPKQSSTSHPLPHTPAPPKHDAPPLSATLSTVPDTDTEIVTNEELNNISCLLLSKCIVQSLHDDLTNLPDVPPSSTPNAEQCQTQFDGLRLHKLFGC